MSHNFEPFANAAPASPAWSRAAVPLAIDRIQGWFRRIGAGQMNPEMKVRLEERRNERARVARDLHETLFQGFPAASMVMHNAVEEIPADSPSTPSLTGTLHLMRSVIDEGRDALRGLRSAATACTSLEHGLAELGDRFASAGTKFRIFVTGRSRALNPRIREQIYLIGREALSNALRHSNATNVESEIEYLPGKLRVVVRDNGSGIDQHLLRNSHWGLSGMRDRARSIGAQLKIWSKRGAGTEVEISILGNVATPNLYVKNNRKAANLRIPALRSEVVPSSI